MQGASTSIETEADLIERIVNLAQKLSPEGISSVTHRLLNLFSRPEPHSRLRDSEESCSAPCPDLHPASSSAQLRPIQSSCLRANGTKSSTGRSPQVSPKIRLRDTPSTDPATMSLSYVPLDLNMDTAQDGGGLGESGSDSSLDHENRRLSTETGNPGSFGELSTLNTGEQRKKRKRKRKTKKKSLATATGGTNLTPATPNNNNSNNSNNNYNNYNNSSSSSSNSNNNNNKINNVSKGSMEPPKKMPKYTIKILTEMEPVKQRYANGTAGIYQLADISSSALLAVRPDFFHSLGGQATPATPDDIKDLTKFFGGADTFDPYGSTRTHAHAVPEEMYGDWMTSPPRTTAETPAHDYDLVKQPVTLFPQSDRPVNCSPTNLSSAQEGEASPDLEPDEPAWP